MRKNQIITFTADFCKVSILITFRINLFAIGHSTITWQLCHLLLSVSKMYLHSEKEIAGFLIVIPKDA